MKRLRGLLRLLLLLPLVLPARTFALASNLSGVMIVELQTTGVNNATSEEFVELYNTSDNTIDISSWKLQYLSAGGTTWQTKATLNGYIYPKGRLLIAATGYLDQAADVTYNPGFKLEAGHVRVAHVDSQNSEQLITEDLVGWGTALYPESQSATYAPAGNSLVRKISDDGTYIDTDNNKNDFDISAIPTPESDNIEPQPTPVEQNPLPENTETPPVDEVTPAQELPQPDPEPQQPIEPVQSPPTTEEIVTPEVTSGIEITELLPDPVSPATDANDEYVELHNLSDQPIELNNFKLQTGNSYTYSYTISGQVLLPNGYMVLYSEQTGLVLSNSGSRARLISPNGSVIAETDSYVNAKPGQAWSLVNGVWTWTTSPTAGNDNILTVPLTVTKTATTNKTSKPKAAKKVVTAKKKQTAKPKTAKAQKAKKDKAAVNGASANGNGDGGGSSSIHRWVIAGLGLLALGYALYEYKDDIASKLRQLRTNRANSRKPRTAS